MKLRVKPWLYLLLFVILAGCSGSHRADSEFIFRGDAQEQTVNLKEYRSVQDRPGQNPEIAVAVSVSGGGYRAANFAAGVLCGLEQLSYREIDLDFLQEVDYFSTVSGGGFTVGLLLSRRFDYLHAAGAPEGFSFCRVLCTEGGASNTLRDSLAFEYVKSLGRTGFSLEAYKLISYNRTRFIERSFDDLFLSVSGRKGRSLLMGDIFVRSGSTKTLEFPYWFQNSTVFENGAIFPHAPDIYRIYGVSGYTHRLNKVEIKSSEDYYKIPMSVGMISSAAYPPLIAPFSMKTRDKDMNNRFLYLVDGGLSDFLGVITALRVLEQEKAAIKVLVIIDAGFVDNEPFSKGPFGPHFLNVSRRALDISADSWRARYKGFVKKYAIGAGMKDIEIISLDFFGLTSQCKETIKDVVARLGISSKDQNALFKAGTEIVQLNARELYCAVMPLSSLCLETDSAQRISPEQLNSTLEMCDAFSGKQ